MKKYDVIERLPISSLKQFIYCQRRFALMYIECEWGSNYKIVEGDILHERVDDPFFNEKRKDIHVSRSVPVYSNDLNLYGIADIIEFIKDAQGIEIPGKKGLWKINPIEYKNGKPEKSNSDNFQLCAQALCLEEMFDIEIFTGDIYYGKIKRRVQIKFTEELRKEVKTQIKNMENLLLKQEIPLKPANQNCNLCSLADICLPEISYGIKRSFRNQIQSLVKGEQSAKIIK